MGQYAKFLVACSAAMMIFLNAAAHGNIARRDWITIGISLLAAFGVWEVPNKPPDDHEDEN